MKNTVILGHGGMAKKVVQYLFDQNKLLKKWNILGYSTNNPEKIGNKIGDYQIKFLDSRLIYNKSKLCLFIGIGFPKLMSSVIKNFINNSNFEFPNLIHPNCYLSNTVVLKRGNIITPGSILSVDVTLGSFNIVNYNVTIGHDATIGSCNVINPGANISGYAVIGSRVLVGTGAQILQGITVCDDVIIGAGAVVTKNIVEAGTYVGVPAKRIQ